MLFDFNFFQLGGKPIIELSSLEEKWKHLCLPKDTLDELLRYSWADLCTLLKKSFVFLFAFSLS